MILIVYNVFSPFSESALSTASMTFVILSSNVLKEGLEINSSSFTTSQPPTAALYTKSAATSAVCPVQGFTMLFKRGRSGIFISFLIPSIPNLGPLKSSNHALGNAKSTSFKPCVILILPITVVNSMGIPIPLIFTIGNPICTKYILSFN